MQEHDRAAAALTKGLSALSGAREDADRWWSGLAPAERRELETRAARAPARVFVRFVDEIGPEEAPDFYEYLVNHEVYLEDARPFRICSAHAAPRAAIARGVLPADFRCPLGRADCPMRELLAHAPGLHVRLTLSEATHVAVRALQVANLATGTKRGWPLIWTSATALP